MPIWTKKQLPKEKVTKKPPGWDQDKWENELNRRFNSIRKNAFDKLYKSCKRKRECHLQEEETECIRKEEEARHAEERRKAERQRHAEEMEKEADQMLQDEFKLSWKELGIDISEDEEDGEVIPEENKESRDDEKSLENGSKSLENGTKGIKSESGNEVPLETEVNKNGDDGADGEDINGAPTVSLGANADEDSASSTLSCGASGQMPTCKSMRLQTKNIALKLNQRSQMSTATVQILSNLSLISALEVFQGTRFGTQDDMELLKNQRVLQALREFHATLDSDVTPPEPPTCPSAPSTLSSAPSTLSSAPTEEEFDEKVVQNIKQEERPKRGAKRKLTDYESFAGVLKSTPKRKKSSKESSVEQTYGSPNRGIISTRDSTKPGMKAMAKKWNICEKEM